MSAEHDMMTYARYKLTRVLARSLGKLEHDAAGLAAQLMQDPEFAEMLLCEFSASQAVKIKHEAVRAEFNGRNGPEVMRRHGISRSMFYHIIGDRRAG